ncbi:MAG: DUF6798 domain-containing protein, partial [Chloroflexota bacterium]|nr:DUF6798 domain-containing protein [Chloroflexota bacterium]
TAAAGLTIAQLILDSDALALIFPWRVSTILVPVSVSIIIGYLVLYISQRFKEQFAKQTNLIMAGGLVIVILSMSVGLVRLKLDFDRKASTDERQMMEFVATNNLPGETYLTPIKMQDFRLETGAPVYVDFKSIPYRDDDVLEWYRRVQIADQFYKTGDCDVLYQLSSSDGVTHAIIENDHANTCQGLSTIYQDEAYTIYELRAD